MRTKLTLLGALALLLLTATASARDIWLCDEMPNGTVYPERFTGCTHYQTGEAYEPPPPPKPAPKTADDFLGKAGLAFRSARGDEIKLMDTPQILSEIYGIADCISRRVNRGDELAHDAIAAECATVR